MILIATSATANALQYLNNTTNKQTNKYKYIFINSEFQNSIERLTFLCRIIDIKIARINPWYVYLCICLYIYISPLSNTESWPTEDSYNLSSQTNRNQLFINTQFSSLTSAYFYFDLLLSSVTTLSTIHFSYS